MRTPHARLASLLALLSPLVLGAVPAAADSTWRGVPTFSILDRVDGDTLVGLDAAPVFLKQDAAPDAALRLDLHGQAVNLQGFGFYGQVPVVRTFGASEFEHTAIGDVELGGLFFTPFDPVRSLTARIGVALPTASDGEAERANNAAFAARITDFALTWPDVTWLRFGVSPALRGELFFARADLGLDVPVHEGDYDADALARLNVGVGIDPGSVAFTAELATLYTFGNFPPSADEQFVHTAALSARWIDGMIQPTVGVGMPIDKSLRDDVSLFLIAGVQAVF
jgi:hypothetical protein